MTLPPESADKTACGSAAINEAGSFPEGGYAGIDTREYWKNWKWQVRHAIRSIDTVQQVLGITFDPEERSQLQKTVDKFPLCITPYYLSLIDTEDYRMRITEMIRSSGRHFPLLQNSSWKIMNSATLSLRIKTVHASVLPTDILTGSFFLSVIPVPCTADTAQGNEKSAT